MLIRAALLGCALAGALAIAGCRDSETGPINVSALGQPPRLINPNLNAIDTPSAFLLEATAQGLVRFNARGEIEPALAQSWIVSDDGLRYTFRLSRATWANDREVTAEQVAARVRAASSRASRNPLKPLLGAIQEVVAMTDDVLEITLKSPRPNFLQLLAQPEMAIIRSEQGTGPYRAASIPAGAIMLSLRAGEDEDGNEASQAQLMLRGERAGLAVARFGEGLADLVTGGTAGDLPIARAAEPPAAALRFDPATGLFGLAFVSRSEIFENADMRRALSMAIDRGAIVAALGVPDLQPRTSIVPAGVQEIPQPASPAWTGSLVAARQQAAARVIADAAQGGRLRVRVALPASPGYRLVFAHLRRDWRAIGVDAVAVAADGSADLRLVDQVAAANLGSWYLRRFTCEASKVCDPQVDAMLDAARIAPTADERRARLADADRLLAELAPFIPITAPVRWSLVSRRLSGFRPNMFGIHVASELVAEVP